MEILIKQVVDSWHLQLKAAGKIIDQLNDDAFLREVVPGKNTGIYLLGHLVAVNDGMLPLFGLGEKYWPELQEPFINQADKSGNAFPEIGHLRKLWSESLEHINSGIQSFTAEDWISRHTAVSEEAFAKEPHRNKINILLSRTSHLAYHLGQIALLK